MFLLYFHLDANIGSKNLRRRNMWPSRTCQYILWLLKGWTRYSTNISIHSLTYAMHEDINLPAWCWCRLCGMMVVRMFGRQRCMKRLWNWRKFFQKVASSAIHLIPYSVRFVGSHDRISACDAIDLDIMHAVCVGEIGDKPDLSLPPLSLLTFSGSVNL